MKILITNDDGIEAPGIILLAEWAKKLGEVTVVAPKKEQSGKSHCIEIHDAYEVIEYKNYPVSDVRAYSVDSSPADCVRIGFNHLCVDFDLVLAGVNRGYNLGGDIVYSGTCGAVFEAAYFGSYAIGLSSDPDSFESARQWLDRIWQFFSENELMKYGHIFNVNIPASPRGIRVTRQGGVYFHDRFVSLGDNMFAVDGYSTYTPIPGTELDTACVKTAGYISVTPLTVSRTDKEVYEKIKDFFA